MNLSDATCSECENLRPARNEYGQLYIVCDCPESERSIKVASKTPESWE